MLRPLQTAAMLLKNHLTWIGLVDAGAPQVAAAQAWRDQTLAQKIKSMPEVRQIHLYSAFNSAQLAVVAQLLEPVESGVSERPPSGLTFRQDLAELSYEKVQSGAVNPEESALLYSVRFVVPVEWTEEFDRWYEEEHLAMIYGCKFWAMTRRYRLVQATPQDQTHLALHYLSDARGFDAPELKESRKTPWRKKFLAERWFTEVEKMIYFRQTPAV